MRIDIMHPAENHRAQITLHNDNRMVVGSVIAPAQGSTATLTATVNDARTYFVQIGSYLSGLNAFYGGTGAKPVANFQQPYELVVSQ